MAFAAHLIMLALCALSVGYAAGATNTDVTGFDGGFQANTCVQNLPRDTTNWVAHVQFGEDVEYIETTATVTKITPRYYRFNSVDSITLAKGSTLCFNFKATCAACTATPPSVDVYVEGSRSTKHYDHAMTLSILFYCAQRSGKLPPDNPINWRGDSGLYDCVTGGWYDAGDHVKFGLPMASSTTILAWSLLRYKAGYERAGQLDEMYDSIKWPLDYFLKAWDSDNEQLVAQVGDGYLDHAYWTRAEDMNMERPCLVVNETVHGSDIAAETAAALAVSSLVFKEKGDTDYASQLLTAAKSLYTFAEKYRGIFTGAEPFYPSTDEKDELCVSAMFLYKATGDPEYLEDAKQYSSWGTAWALTWDTKIVTCQLLLFEELKYYDEPVEKFLNQWRNKNDMKYTPCGLAWRDRWGVNRYAANTAFAAMVAADLGIDPYENRKWAIEQINFLLGDNNVASDSCFSYLVGYGYNYPLRPHHRGASCPAKPEDCNYGDQDKLDPNPQILYGALVGGPTSSGVYDDSRTNYESNEVTTDYNAGFQGTLAAILQLETTKDFPETDNACPCQE